MIGFEFKIEHLTPRLVNNYVADRSFKNLGHASSAIRKDAIASIKPGPTRQETLPSGRVVTRKVPSRPGTPPHTHTAGVTKKGKPKAGFLPRAIVFVVDKAKQEAVIGPRASIIGESGGAHELGGEFRGQDYPERAYMYPALQRNLSRFGSGMAASLGE